MVQRYIPVIGKFGLFGENRDTSFELQTYRNGFFQVYPQAFSENRKACFQKRPGMLEATQLAALSSISTFNNNYKVQGVVNSLDRQSIIIYANNGAAKTSYHWDGTTRSTNAPPASFTNTGPVVFERLDGISYGANNYYAATDFTAGAVLTAAGVWTEITDVDFTGLTKVTNFIGLDGYLFIGTSNNRIYNSDLNTPTTWSATSFLTVADTPGSIVWLGRIRNYLVVFKQYSIEFYENIGRPTPGSPLGAQKQLNRRIGCAAKSSVQVVSDGIVFLGTDDNGRVAVYKLVESTLELKEISDEYVSACCAAFPGIDSSYAVDATTGGSATHGESQVVTYQGKEFYLLNLNDPGNGATRQTMVYDNDIDAWIKWNTHFTFVPGDDSFESGQAILFKKSNVLYTLFFTNVLSGASTAPLMHAWTPSSIQYKDWYTAAASRDMYFQWISDIYDFGTRQRKFMDSLEILYDCDPSQAPNVSASTTFDLSILDTDYSTSPTGHGSSKLVPYDVGMYKRAKVTRLGSFFSRAFVITIVDSNPWRLWGLNTFIDTGDTENVGAAQ